MFHSTHRNPTLALLLFLSLLTAPLLGSASANEPQKAAATSQEAGTVKGKVLETMDAPGYTYLKVETAQGQKWVAIPAAKVTVGQEISYYDGMVMPNFTSKTLGRTFEAIVFSAGLAGPGQAAAVDGQNTTMTNPHATAAPPPAKDSFAAALQAESTTPRQVQAVPEKSGGSLAAIVPQIEGKVAKAEGENGYTVGEIFAQKETLNGKTARVHGKVVKVSRQIMGKNWIHLQDGSGETTKNTHDLVVTSTEDPGESKEITIEGKVSANKDFGAGYRYEALIEEAKILK